MSRGIINIVLYDIDQAEETIEQFTTDPSGFLAQYRLTEDERAAFERSDYGALYAMGAHPFLLWQVVRSLAMIDSTPMPALIEEYRNSVSPHGTPDHIT